MSLIPSGFQFYDGFLNPPEQRLLLEAALKQLDMRESAKYRQMKRRAVPLTSQSTTDVLGLFYPDEYYEFQPGHYDGVIRNYREAHVTSWANSDEVEQGPLWPILRRIRALLPFTDVQTHVLHLGHTGEILPHIDNISASGAFILGVSLGATRILRMEAVDSDESFEALVPSGSVYIQRDDVRYRFKHSIGTNGMFDRQRLPSGPRVSLMLRDFFPHKQNGAGQIQLRNN